MALTGCFAPASSGCAALHDLRDSFSLCLPSIALVDSHRALATAGHLWAAKLTMHDE